MIHKLATSLTSSIRDVSIVYGLYAVTMMLYSNVGQTTAESSYYKEMKLYYTKTAQASAAVYICCGVVNALTK